VIQDASTALLRRLERGALVWCVLAVVVVLVAAPSRTDVMLGVAGGGLLAVTSFYAIRGSVDAALRAFGQPARPEAAGPSNVPGPPDAPPQHPPRVGSVLVKAAGRYALLALLAYVMIARLRLHPLGLLLGMTALAVSATAEAVRSLGRPGKAP
jgi:hypothetical protein